ncbi:MAG TPA: hypothetical protein VIK30_06780 [Polyangia bacterium]
MAARTRRLDRWARAPIAIACLALVATSGCAGPTAAGGATAATKPGAAAAPVTAPLVYGVPDGSDGADLERAVDEMDRGELELSIATLQALRSKHPDNGTVLHELALAHRMSRQPRRAVELLLPYRAELPPQMLSALASAFDEAGDRDQAEAMLRQGLAQYPKAGVLYSDLGTTVRGGGRLDEALRLYLQGIEAEPSFPGNYRRAAELYAKSESRGLALVYGEMFRVLDPGHSAEMSKLLVEVCRNAVIENGGKKGDATTALGPKVTYVEVGPGGKLKGPVVPLSWAIELGYGPALIAAHEKGLSLASLHEARKMFMLFVQKPSGPFESYKIALFPWLTALAAAGHLEAYDHWLYGAAFPDEMKRWGEQHPKEVEAMANWAHEHPLFGK